MTISEWDKDHVEEILHGHGNWFGAQLLRLIAHADDKNLAKLAVVFPEHVDAYIAWFTSPTGQRQLGEFIEKLRNEP